MEVIVILLACLLAPSLGAQSRHPTIIGANTTDYVDIQDHPYMLSLRFQGNHVCGAAAIAPQWAITSRECVAQNVTTCLTLHSDHASLAGRSTSHPVTNIVGLAGYSSTTHELNVALLKVSVPFRADNIIRVANLEPDILSHATFTGWGSQSEDFDDSNPFLAKSNMTVIGVRSCQAEYDPDIITDDMLCATGFNVTTSSGLYHKDPCIGDWGGPLVGIETGVRVLIGVSSFAVGCGRTNRPSVFARVTYPTIRSWITTTAGV